MAETIKADVAVIGGGPGGTASAFTTADGGKKTILMDSSGIGGACLNRGCVPAKAWLAGEHLFRLAAWGEKTLGTPRPSLDFARLREHTRKVVDNAGKGLLSVFRKKGVEIIRGSASFTSPRTLSVNGGEKTVEFNHAVIATGSRPIDLFENLADFYNTDTIFGMEKLPSSLAVIGGGAVGMEMAAFFSGMGCDTLVIEALDDVLSAEDAEIRAVVKRELGKNGVKFKTGTTVEEARREGGMCELRLNDGSTVKTAAVLCAVGRKPNTEGLGLENAGVRTLVKGFIDADGAMCTSREGIYAVGDAAGKRLLAYTAHHEGVTAGRNILGKPEHMDYRFVPSIIFTNPEIGSVGATEENLKNLGGRYSVGRYHVRALARAQVSGEIAGMAKALVGEDKSILGIHIASPFATELIHAGVVAMTAGMKADALAAAVFGHPTLSEAVSLAVADALGTSIYS